MALMTDVDYIGRTIDRYAILSLIRAGTQGRVYRGRDELLRREVAIKVPNADRGCWGRSPESLIAEARALSSLNHPNVADVYDFVTEEAREFLVMEFIAGAALDQVLAAGPLPLGEVLRLGAQLARGLSAIHAAQLAHCDIKPGNLKITSAGLLKIVDFGLARRLSDPLLESASTSAPTVAGTFPYMAPEVMRGEEPDPRSDIFSAGAVLFEMATGCRAFPQQTLPALVKAIEHEDVVPPSRLNPAMPGALDRVVMTALEKLPARRYRSGAELMRAIDALARRGGRRAARSQRSRPPAPTASVKSKWWHVPSVGAWNG